MAAPAFQHPEEAWGQRSGNCPGNARAAMWPGTVLSSVVNQMALSSAFGHGECNGDPAGPGGLSSGPEGQAEPPPGQVRGCRRGSLEGARVWDGVVLSLGCWSHRHTAGLCLEVGTGCSGVGEVFATSSGEGLEETPVEAVGDMVSAARDSCFGHPQARLGTLVAVLLL